MQLAKSRFGKGTWKLHFTIGSLRAADGSMSELSLPANDDERIELKVF